MATNEQCVSFINKIAPVIQKYAKSKGYHVASPIIAQACCESAYGTSKLAGAPIYNFFGMKCGSAWTGRSYNATTKEEYTKGNLTTIKANFRCYDSFDEGVAGYFDFISKTRYANLKDAKTPLQYLEYIKADGYATSSTYVNTNMSIINKWDLTKYDNFDSYKGKSGAELAEYALSKVGTPYFFGSKMNVLTEGYMNTMHKMYPGTVTESYMQKARNKGQVGKVNTDCSGLIGAYREKQIGSSQLYSTAKKRMPISQVNDFGVGVVLWKQGHVGVYVGNGYCVEAKSLDKGTIKSKVSDTKWTYGLTFDDMVYSYEKTICGKEKIPNPYKEPTAILKKGSKGDGVKWLQFELNESGFTLEVDGIFGSKTHEAVITYQKSCKIEVDGEVGKITRSCLKNE